MEQTIDFGAIRRDVDLLSLIESDRHCRREAGTHGGEYSTSCPACGGDDRLRFWPGQGTFWCRGCDQEGDAVDWVRLRDGVGTRDACTRLGAYAGQGRGQRPEQPETIAVAGPEWRAAAREVVAACQDDLFSPAAKSAWRYLEGERGLSTETIILGQIGYNPRRREIAGLFVPPGITLPWQDERGEIVAIKIRLFAAGGPKYGLVRGSQTKGVLYGAETLPPRAALAVLCEGEFDTLLLRQLCGDLAPVVSLGSASTPLAGEALRRLTQLRRWFLCMDPDVAGNAAALKTVFGISQRARLLDLPYHGDVTDTWRAGIDLHPWLQTCLEKELHRCNT